MRSMKYLVLLSFWGFCGHAWAVPGPDSVAVVANGDIPESVALAKAYAKARHVPDNQVCLLKLPKKDDITFAEYQKSFLTPFEACLRKGSVTNRIEAVVLMRGVPMRVSITGGRGSLAAVLGMWKSTVTNGGKAVVGLPVGLKTRFLQAGWRNAFRSGVFRPGWSLTSSFSYTANNNTVRGQFAHKPLLVTMLHGRSYKDAGLLLKSAIDAEAKGAAKGQFLFMNGRDSARGVLDREYDGIIAQLKQRGFTNSVREKFNANLTGRNLASFMTGTATLGTTIEGNTYLPGSLTCNLTSFGALPRNFQPTGQSQVSIARWVAKGVAGAHGTTDEPLNNVFPSRYLIVDYVDGSTLAEAYLRRMPYAYWRNLVLGDPMAAPYAQRPIVKIAGLRDNTTVAGARKVTVTATDPGKRGIASISLIVDGKVVATSKKSPLEACVTLPQKAGVQILAVAQAAPAAGNNRRKYQPKGWLSINADGAAGGPKDCAAPEPTPEPSPKEQPSERPAQDASAPQEPPGEPATPDRNVGPIDDIAQPDTQQPDTGTPSDTGATVDNASPGTDAAPTPDVQSGNDAPSASPDNGENPKGGGCGCHTQSPSPWSFMAFLLLFAVIGLRRR